MFRLMNRLNAKLEKFEQYQEELSEQEAADYLGVKVTRLRNMIYDKTIKPDAYFELINGERKFYKYKLKKD